MFHSSQQQQHQHSDDTDHPNRSSHSSLSGWISGLSRRLSLPPSHHRRQQRSGRSGQSASFSSSEPTAVVPAAPTIVISDTDSINDTINERSVERLNHSERHEINLMYHLLRDHRDALQLCGTGLLRGRLVDDEQVEVEEAGRGLWHWGGASYCEADEKVSECGSEDAQCGLAKCDSDSCLSTCSGCSKRFKHQRRTDRWNQEYDLEFREKHGLVDRSYFNVHQIK